MRRWATVALLAAFSLCCRARADSYIQEPETYLPVTPVSIGVYGMRLEYHAQGGNTVSVDVPSSMDGRPFSTAILALRGPDTVLEVSVKGQPSPYGDAEIRLALRADRKTVRESVLFIRFGDPLRIKPTAVYRLRFTQFIAADGSDESVMYGKPLPAVADEDTGFK